LVLATAGGLWFAYAYVTDSSTLAGLIKAEAPRYLPGALLDIGRVRVHPFSGEVVLTQLTVRQTLDKVPFLVARLPWVRVQFDTQAMLNGEFVPREVVVAQPTLRLRRRKDGTWNLKGLLADPWPGPVLKRTPTVVIQNGTVELSDGEDGTQGTAILRDVALRVEPARGGLLHFEGTAKGDVLDRLTLQGTIDPASGRVTLKGDVARLAISETLRGRVPAEFRPLFKEVGLTGGEVDLRLGQVVYDPKASPKVRYEATGRLRAGVWNCPKLPFRIDNLAAGVAVRDGVLTIKRAEGYNGSTTVRAEGTIGLGDPKTAPMDLQIDVIDLELDQRLRDWTPPEFVPLWSDYRPRGRVSVSLQAVRAEEGGQVGFGLRVTCHDVAMTYKYFPYPLDHIWGVLTWEKQQVLIDLRALVGGKPLTGRGTIDMPGPDAHVQLDFEAEAFPIDKTLFAAIPADIRKVVSEFQPTGTVRGRTHVDRLPPASPNDPPEGRIAIHSYLDLDDRVSIKWVGLPYPVMNMTGRLELHPDRWEFKNMKGSNGQASITGSGRVQKVAGPGENPLRVDLDLSLDNLPFDDQLRQALPPAWQKTWAILNPTGASNVDAKIVIVPGKPDHYHLEIAPKPYTSIRLKYYRAPRPGIDPGGTFEMPMEDVGGRFVFDNGTVAMSDVNFLFRGAPVQFERGTVVVEDSGRFNLGVSRLWVKDFRLETVRSVMPPIMAQFARRIDDGKPFTIKGNLGIGWSGDPRQPTWCRWNHALVIFNDNSIQAGLPLEHMQGQLENVEGTSDGDRFDVQGILRLASVSLLGQQVTQVESPFRVERGVATMSDVKAKLLGGDVFSKVKVSLDATPRYSASVNLQGADLQRYSKTLSGRQTFRGLVYGRVELTGLGNDLRTLEGSGEAHIMKGDLGELPVVLRLFNFLKLSPATKTAFDSADVTFSIRDGETSLTPIKLTGNAFSLQGRGRLGVQGDLDLRLNILYGRDRIHLPIISDALREASGQLFVVRVLGTPSYPKFKLEALPQASDMVKAIASPRRPRERE
jgi:hypothetical protein